MLNLISAAILMHAGSFDCNEDGIPDQFQTCLDCDDNGLLDPAIDRAVGWPDNG